MTGKSMKRIRDTRKGRRDMARLIDADAVKELIRSGISTDTCADQDYVCELVDDIPTIDAVSVVHGEWLDEHEDGHGYWVGTCSQCGKEKRVDNYCPNCGAQMKGADDE